MARPIANIAASVHQRLLQKAQALSRPFNELLQRFAMERFLYRLARLPQGGRFILKGALMLWVWRGPASRPTMDIDLLGTTGNHQDAIVVLMRDACMAEVEADGLSFDPASVTAAAIAEHATSEGVRVRLRGRLGNARVSLQVDIGFGDPVVPGPTRVVYPTLLDFPPPEMSGYTMESVIAEKFQALMALGILNSRMKDFYDLWMLSHWFDFEGERLALAVRKTFEHRRTPLSGAAGTFALLGAGEVNKNIQWLGFVRKAELPDAPASFGEVVGAIASFLELPAAALIEGRPFYGSWKAPGPWRLSSASS